MSARPHGPRPSGSPQSGPGLWESPEAEETAGAPPGSDRVLIVEADGGSRGNPGPAAYGALVRDGSDFGVLDREGQTIGRDTNNVAEYSGLIAGLEMARALDPAAEIDVRMDSKLVIEQMSGRWKIKHPSMRPLAMRARELLPARVRWTWVPRAENKAADALVNAALDGDPVRRRPTGPQG